MRNTLTLTEGRLAVSSVRGLRGEGASSAVGRHRRSRLGEGCMCLDSGVVPETS